MKLQYAGDVRDFWKWHLLRHLDESSLRVCWMLTENDDTNQGADIAYQRRRRYRDIDPDLVDELSAWRANGGFADLPSLEARVRTLLPGVDFHAGVEPGGKRLVFFDPDIGVAWARSPTGSPDQYLQADQFKRAFEASSVLVFQWAQVPQHAENARQRIQEWCGIDPLVFTPHVSANVHFLLAPRPEHRSAFDAKLASW